jgi:hypothetical protein
VVTVLLGAPPVPERGRPAGLDLDQAERTAIAVLAGSGLVPPLRLVAGEAAAARPGEAGAASPGAPPQGLPDVARGRPCRRADAGQGAAEAG